MVVRKDMRPTRPEDLGNEDGGVALCLGASDLLQRRRANLHRWERAAHAERGAWAGVRQVGRVELFYLCGWFNTKHYH